jgi:hypothetical protein
MNNIQTLSFFKLCDLPVMKKKAAIADCSLLPYKVSALLLAGCSSAEPASS